MERTRWDPFIVFPTIAAVLLGLIGYMPGLGMLGPFGQGSTGQIGVLVGCCAGLAAAKGGLRNKGFLIALLFMSAVWTAVLVVWRPFYLASVR